MEVRIDDKKLSIRHYVDSNLKPTIKNGVEMFPVYFQVNYNNKNTKFRAFTNLNSKRNENILLPISEKDSTGKDSEFETAYKQIIEILEHEINKYKGKFTLKGFNHRLDVYSSPIFLIFYSFNYLTIRRMEDIFSSMKAMFESLEAGDKFANLLIGQVGHKKEFKVLVDFVGQFQNIMSLLRDSKFNKITCFEWSFKNGKKEIIDIYKKEYTSEFGMEIIEELTSILDHSINYYLFKNEKENIFISL